MKVENFWERVSIEVVSNSIKSLVIIGLSALVVTLAAIYNPLVDIVNKYVPKTILIILPLTLLLLLVISVSYISYLRKKMKAELKQALGVYWDKDYNTYCPSCKKLLSNYAYHRSGDKLFPGFKCINCKEVVRMSDGENMFLKFEEAKEIVKVLIFKKRTEPASHPTASSNRS